MSDKLQFVVRSFDKLKLVGHQTISALDDLTITNWPPSWSGF